MKPQASFLYNIKTIFALVIMVLGFASAEAQFEHQLQSAIDSTSVPFGAVINYAIQVQDNKDKLVSFPDDKSFAPLEVIESFKIDTLEEGNRYRILKQYALTNFDPGSYTIPKQKVQIGSKTFYTDSLQVEFRDVVVDTSKVKLYDIKGLMSVEEIKETNWTKILYWVIGVLIFIAIVLLIIWKFGIGVSKPEEKLPPFEKAMKGFSDLGTDLIDSKNYKAYYSQITDLAKNYIDEKVSDKALESTTDELVQILIAKNNNQEIFIEETAIQEFENIFKTADLVKFAAINPPEGVAENDKNAIQDFIGHLHRGLPEPTEEELLKDEAYRQEVARKQKLKRNRAMIIGSLLALIIAGGSYLVSDNFHNIKSYVLDKSGAALLHGDWVTSSYGVPGVSLSSPVLLTRNPIELSAQEQQMLLGRQVYSYGNLIKKFNLLVNTITFRQDVGFTVDAGLESVFQQLEQMGAKNIVVKTEDFKTITGTEGGKAFGSFDFQIPETTIEVTFDYTVVIFAEGQGTQQVMIMYEQDDADGKKVMERIVKSIKINKSNN